MDIETAMTNEKNPLLASEEQRVLNQTGFGARLKMSREMMRLTEKEVAIRLHLNSKMITIMETEDFDNGPPATFMRGYLRAYARILNIPEEEINAAVTHLESNLPQTPHPSAPPILNTRNIHENHQYLRWMTYVVVAVLIVLVSIWWTSHPKDILIISSKITAPSAAAPTPAAHVANTIPAPTPTTPSSAQANTAPLPIETNQPPIPVETPAAVNATPPAPTPAAPPAAPLTQAAPPANVAPTTPAVTPPPAAAPVQAAPEQDKSSNDTDDLNMALPEPGLEQEDN